MPGLGVRHDVGDAVGEGQRFAVAEDERDPRQRAPQLGRHARARLHGHDARSALRQLPGGDTRARAHVEHVRPVERPPPPYSSTLANSSGG